MRDRAGHRRVMTFRTFVRTGKGFTLGIGLARIRWDQSEPRTDRGSIGSMEPMSHSKEGWLRGMVGSEERGPGRSEPGYRSRGTSAAVLPREGPSMHLFRPATIVLFLAPLLLTLPMVSQAVAGDHHDHYSVIQDPSIGYAVPIQRVYQYPGAIVFQPTAPYGYAMPIQRVYQFPAALVFQPGPEIPFHATAGSWYDQYGGPSFIPR